MKDIIKEVNEENNNINSLSPIEDKRIKRNTLIYNTIKEYAPVSPYRLGKILKDISYTTICRSVREFEFAGLIEIKVILNKQNHAVKMIRIPTGKFMTSEDLNNG